MIALDVCQVFPDFVECLDFVECRSAGVLLRCSCLKMHIGKHLRFFSQCVISPASLANMLYIAVSTLANVVFDWELAFIYKQQKLIEDSITGWIVVHTYKQLRLI